MKLVYPDYNNSILNVSNSLLKHYGVSVKYNTIAELDNELKKNYNHIIYILLDGMGVNVIKYHLSKNDSLHKYMVKEITSVFPPTTVAATDAVLSGLPPISNGHLGWSQYFKNEDTNLVVFQNFDYYTQIKQKVDLRKKYLSFKRLGEQITDINPSIVTKEYFPDFLEGGSKSFAEEIERVLLTTHNTDQSFNYVYWTQPDLFEHIYGVYSSEVKEVITNLNHDFSDLIDNITDDTLVVAIADHGLINIEEILLKDYPELTSLLLRKPSIEPRATNFFVKKGKEELFKDTFNKLFSQKFRLYSKQELLASKLFGEGVMHSLVPDFLGEYMAIAIDKYMFVFEESNNYIGHHAGLSEEEMMVPLIMCSKKQ